MYLLFFLFILINTPLIEASQSPLLPEQTPFQFTTYQSEISPAHSVRIRKQDSAICNTTVDQYTGWLDVGAHHLFFWYFDDEDKAVDADEDVDEEDKAEDEEMEGEPLTLWLTGGPGSSSIVAMLGELGPCKIDAEGNSTVPNPYSWNKNTSLIFVDQPSGVGFSYSDEGEPVVGDSFTSAVDMRIFLQLFISQVFPKHLKGPLLLTGESYAGHYLPALGAEIIRNNHLHPSQIPLRLKSLAIGNGLVSPLDTIFGTWETLCTTNPGVENPVFNETRCDIIATNLPRCMEVLKTCSAFPDVAICNAAFTVCHEGVLKFYYEESGLGGRNSMDITKPCEVSEYYCYLTLGNIESFLNLPKVFKALGIPSVIKHFYITSQAVHYAFQIGLDMYVSFQPQIVFLLENQVDVLIYQGNLDLTCNTAGAERWMADMGWKGQAAFVAREMKPWRSVVDGEELEVGMWKEVGVRMGEGEERTRFVLVTVDGAGHLLPMDQPEIALDLFSRWLSGKCFG